MLLLSTLNRHKLSSFLESYLSSQNHQLIHFDSVYKLLSWASTNKEMINETPIILLLAHQPPEILGINALQKLNEVYPNAFFYSIIFFPQIAENYMVHSIEAGVDDVADENIADLQLHFKIVKGIKSLELRKLIKRQQDELYNKAQLSTLGKSLAELSHEIKNPLGVILGKSAMAIYELEGTPQPNRTVLKHLETIASMAFRIKEISEGLLKIAKGGEKQEFKKVKIQDFIRDALTICDIKFRKNNISFVLNAPNTPIEIEGRRVALSQVILNLLDNAVEAVKKQEEKQIRIEILEREKEIEILVEDNGKGILPEIKDTLMLPFISGADDHKGSGLGLSISKTIIEDHLGTLSFTEAKGKTIFHIILPKEQIATSINAKEGPAEINNIGELKVLVVDDDPNYLEIIRFELERKGIKNVFTALNAEEALKLAKKESIPIILTDLVMPKFSGKDLIKKISEEFENANNKPITFAYSGYPDLELKKALSPYGLADLLSKPFNVDRFISGVGKHYKIKEI